MKLKKDIRRILLTVAALLIPAAGVATLGLAGTAGAAGKMECTSISGNASSYITVSGCTGRTQYRRGIGAASGHGLGEWRNLHVAIGGNHQCGGPHPGHHA